MLPRGKYLACLALNHRKYSDQISGGNNTVKSYYANDSSDPETTKKEHFAIMLGAQDSYSNVMGVVKVFEQT